MTDMKTLITIDRRVTLKWLMGAMAVGQLAACGDGAKGISWPELEAIKAQGVGKDPDLLNPVVPWPLTMTAAELAITAELVDLILPAEGDHSRAIEGRRAGLHQRVGQRALSGPAQGSRADRQRPRLAR